jgi:hypothetical protein
MQITRHSNFYGRFHALTATMKSRQNRITGKCWVLLYLRWIYFQIFKSKHNNSIYCKAFEVLKATRHREHTDTHRQQVTCPLFRSLQSKNKLQKSVRAE